MAHRATWLKVSLVEGPIDTVQDVSGRQIKWPSCPIIRITTLQTVNDVYGFCFFGMRK